MYGPKEREGVCVLGPEGEWLRPINRWPQQGDVGAAHTALTGA